MNGPGAKHTGVVIRSKTRLTLSEARNLAASKGRGEYLLFMDDDNAAKPGEVSALVTAAMATGADISAPGDDYLVGSGSPHGASPTGRWFPLGGTVGVGVFRDCYGDANALIKRSTFNELGGWRVSRGRGGTDSTGEDWELFARAVLRGYTLQVVPYPLFWYRQAPGSMVQTTSLHLYRSRVLTPFAEKVPTGLTGALELAKTLAAERGDAPARAAKAFSKAAAGSIARDQLLCGAMLKKRNGGGGDDGGGMKNLVKNHDFGSSASGEVVDWEVFSDGYDWFKHGDSSLAMTVKSRDRARGARQVIRLEQTDATGPEPILLGARSRAETPDIEEILSPDYSVYADLTHTDGTESYGYFVPFPGRRDWEWGVGVIVPDKPVVSVQLYCLFRHRIGTAWFDDVVLRPLTGEDVCGAADDNDTNNRRKSSGGRDEGGGVVFTKDTPFLVRNTHS